MGGLGSGRSRWKNTGTVDDGISLDIRVLRRRGWLVDGACSSQNLRWTSRLRGTLLETCRLTADLRYPADRCIVLEYPINGINHFQKIGLIARTMPFGGQRLFFQCPWLCLACEVMPLGSHGFASRQANKMTYRTQSEGVLGRNSSARAKLHDRLWPLEGHRKAARGKNRERLMDRYLDLEMAADAIMDAV